MPFPEIYYFINIYELVFYYFLSQITLVKSNVSWIVQGVVACNEVRMLN